MASDKSKAQDTLEKRCVYVGVLGDAVRVCVRRVRAGGAHHVALL